MTTDREMPKNTIAPRRKIAISRIAFVTWRPFQSMRICLCQSNSWADGSLYRLDGATVVRWLQAGISSASPEPMKTSDETAEAAPILRRRAVFPAGVTRRSVSTGRRRHRIGR
jgi:hypothetical protein